MLYKAEQKVFKVQKRFRIANIALNLSIILFLIALAIYYFISNNASGKQYACLGIIGASFFPVIFEIVTRKRIPNYLYLFLNLYIIFAGVWGSALYGYSTYWWFDIVIHTLMGYFAAAIGLFLLCVLDDQKKMKFFTVALFCLGFSLLIEGIWELFEFGMDYIIPSFHMQGENYANANFPLVADTMTDILCNFMGAFVFFLQYIIAKATRKNLGIESMINEFSINKRRDNKPKSKKIENDE